MSDPHLTLEQKIGQLFVLGFAGREPDAETRALLEAIQPVAILLQRNIELRPDLRTHLPAPRNVRDLAASGDRLEGGRVDRPSTSSR
jgi:beta-glucosidase-like glycosyl hydrolase